MGIGIRNLSAAAEVESEVTNYAAALQQTAAGLLGTTVQLADLVSDLCERVRPRRRLTSAFLAGDPVRGGRVHVHRRCGGLAHVRRLCPLFAHTQC